MLSAVMCPKYMPLAILFLSFAYPASRHTELAASLIAENMLASIVYSSTGPPHRPCPEAWWNRTQSPVVSVVAKTEL